MAGYIAIVAATVWTAAVVETIIESVRTFGGSIQFFGRTLIAPGIRPGVMILCGLAASAGLAWAAAVAYARGRRLERRMAAELADRWRDRAEREVAEQARKDLLAWRIGELQALVDGLLDERRGRHEPRRLFVVPDMPDERATSAEPTARSRR
jgi:hypothetical protein